MQNMELNEVQIPSSSINTKHLKRKAGRKKVQETRHPLYKGVRHKNGKWVCELRQPYNPKSRIWVGTFKSPEMAARAYDMAALALRGDSASLNFPQLAHLLPNAKSSSIQEIQSAAMEAAHGSFSTREDEERRVIIDEEELFNLPQLLDTMEEGLIVTPPLMKTGFNWNDYEEEDVVDLTLWTH